MAKTIPATKETKGEVTFTLTTRDNIPTIARAGRSSKYEPLYTRAKTLGAEEVLQMPIAKYSQVQAFKPRLAKMNLTVSVRKTEKGLVAYIAHPEPEQKS